MAQAGCLFTGEPPPSAQHPHIHASPPGPSYEYHLFVPRYPAREPEGGSVAVSGGATPLTGQPLPGEVLSAAGPLLAAAQGKEGEVLGGAGMDAGSP